LFRPPMTPATRRRFLQLSAAAATTFALGCPGKETVDTSDTGAGDTGPTDTGSIDTGSEDTAAGGCELTGEDIQGPYYREDAPSRANLDLYDDPGTRMMLTGHVLDTDCNPIPNAKIEIWHCDEAGDYDNESKDMKYRGVVVADAKGEWTFDTLKPGFYAIGVDTYRPAHVHVKIFVDEVEELTTQLYFEGDPYNKADTWYDPSREMAIESQTDGSIICRYEFAVEL
jgi:protocatechuate 3,4-dioxygenase beta subunit